ncbi:hypothetical protein FGIG_07327 [Fasciola gigantica]|uniref:Uncharacterized protein n=1 Tax=Fasciola gigantica TaxID=46835 RepID=A0A504YSB0_FASGI|nr:hypothetical protein FGIG_07327 [Fasciola gigantica]
MSYPGANHNYLLSKPALRGVVGCMVGGDEELTKTNDCKAEVPKRHSQQTRMVDSGDYTTHNTSQATTKMDDFLIYPGKVAETTRRLRASKAARSDELYPAINQPLNRVVAEALTPFLECSREQLHALWSGGQPRFFHSLGWVEGRRGKAQTIKFIVGYSKDLEDPSK